MTLSEGERIRSVYAQRTLRVDQHRYTPFDPSHLLVHYSRQRAFLGLLKNRGIESLAGLRVLEVGCGAGSILLEYLEYGAKPADLFGVDFLHDDLCQAHERSPSMGLSCADGRCLPFPSGSFDLVTLYTVFTSVLDTDIRGQLAAEVQRVLSATGLVVVYDFWPDNPWNSNVRGLSLSQVKVLFPGHHYDAQRIVLAPPLARPIARFSPLVCQLLEKLPFLCTHYVITIG